MLSYTDSLQPLSTHNMSFDRLTKDHVFRSITSFLSIIEGRTSRTASDPRFYFTNTKNDLTAMAHRQLCINTALSVCAVRSQEVIAVVSSSDKTANVSRSYVVTVNPKRPSDNKHSISTDVLFHQTLDDDNAMPHLVSGKGNEAFLKNPNAFIQGRL